MFDPCSRSALADGLLGLRVNARILVVRWDNSEMIPHNWGYWQAPSTQTLLDFLQISDRHFS